MRDGMTHVVSNTIKQNFRELKSENHQCNEHDFEGPVKIIFVNSASSVGGKCCKGGGKQLGNGRDGELIDFDFTVSLIFYHNIVNFADKKVDNVSQVVWSVSSFGNLFWSLCCPEGILNVVFLSPFDRLSV